MQIGKESTKPVLMMVCGFYTLRDKQHQILRRDNYTKIYLLTLIYSIRQAKLKHKICVRKGNVKPKGREALYFKFYDK